VEGTQEREPELYNEIAAMNVAQRLKLALRGNRDARTLLARDNNKVIRRFVLNNPMITEEEIVNIARDRNSTEDVLRFVSERGEWMKSYGVRRALATNPKTPLVIAQKQLATLLLRTLRASRVQGHSPGGGHPGPQDGDHRRDAGVAACSARDLRF
jgi:hypothetical protein